ncbi:hypothetical protein AAG570_009141 [Ranatra chinensis]|uniref:Uncharacterized protein n=1 Tax=Ranatra chinensis TaxID=642074 RepID=A0ABD0YSZ1_9HEMI
MASKRRNMFHKNKTQETTEEGALSPCRARRPDDRIYPGDEESETEGVRVRGSERERGEAASVRSASRLAPEDQWGTGTPPQPPPPPPLLQILRYSSTAPIGILLAVGGGGS